jgi:hypothetical protein
MAIPETLEKALTMYQRCHRYSDAGEIARKSRTTPLFQQFAEFATSFDRDIAFEFSGKSKGSRGLPSGNSLGAWLLSYDWHTLLLSDPNGSRKLSSPIDGIVQCSDASLGASKLIPNVLVGSANDIFACYEFDLSHRNILKGKNGDERLEIYVAEDSGLISLVRIVELEHPRAARLAALEEELNKQEFHGNSKVADQTRQTLEILRAQPEQLSFIETEYRFNYAMIE